MSGAPTTELPMFPLGTVLVPGAYLPLQLFEPRYLELARVCTQGSPEFGVVLIDRGHEVGGGDVRRDVGCVARIVEATELPDGRWTMVTVGAERIRVERWLPDAPYPRADVTPWPDAPAGPDAAERRDAVESRLRRVLAMAVELGSPVPSATVDLDPDPSTAGWQAAAMAPIGPADRYDVLASPGPDERLELLTNLLDEQIAVLAHRLSGG